MEYVVNTNVLRTSVTCADGRFDVYDYAPRIPSGLDVDAPIEIQRLIVPREGAARVRVLFDPEAGLCRRSAPEDRGDLREACRSATAPSALYLRTNAPLPYLESGQPLRIDEPFYFAVSYGKPSDTDSVASAQRVRDLTIAGWRAWAKSCALPTFASLPVLRSALCLKLHAYTDTGAIIAAATTSIPEAVGSERTWDYRYCWLRDAAFVVEALRRVGHLAEGEAFVSFLRDVAEAGPLQPLYGIGGERELVEQPSRSSRGILRQQACAHRQRGVPAAAARSDGRDDSVPRHHHRGPARRHRGNGTDSPVGRAVRRGSDGRRRDRRHRALGVPHLPEQVHVLARVVLGRRQPRREARSAGWDVPTWPRTGRHGPHSTAR